MSFDDSGNVTDCIFTEQFRKNKKIYTRLERNTIENDELTITNLVFVSTNPEVLGTEVPISYVDKWNMLESELKFKNVDKLPIGFFKVPLANIIDSTSPIGVSVYSRQWIQSRLQMKDIRRLIGSMYQRKLHTYC